MTLESFKELRKSSLRRLNRRWAKTPKWLCRLILCAIFLGIGWLLAKPAYSRARRWLVERNFNAAIEASEAHQPAKARELALAVTYTGDTRIAMLRVLERSANELGDARYERFAGSLLNHPQCTGADRLRVFQNLARNVPFGRLQSHWAGLKDSDRADLPFRLALVDRILRDGAFNPAMTLLGELPANPPDPEVASRRIRCLIGQCTESSLELAQQRLVALWQQQPGRAADWVALLKLLPVEALDPFILSPLRPALSRGLPGKPGEGELIDARIRWQAGNPAEQNALTIEIINRWRSEAAVELCAFLTAVNQPERLVTTFTDEAVTGNPDLIKARLQALIQLSRDPEVATTLKLHGASLEPIDQMAYAAQAAHRINDDANLNLCWNKGLVEGVTSQHPDALLELHHFANRAGMVAEAERALVAAIKAARGPLPPYDALTPALESLTRKGLEHDLMSILNEYLKLEPWNPLVISRHGYLTALLGLEKPAEVIPRVQKLTERLPDNTQILAVLATVQLLAEQPDAASATWRKLSSAPQDLTLGYRAAYLATEVLSGRLERSAPAVRAFPWKDLMPGERNHFGKLVRPEEVELQTETAPDVPTAPAPTVAPGATIEDLKVPAP